MTPKQERFVQEYLIDSNATQAAIRAGYSAKTAGAIGHENLNKPEIAAEIAERTEKVAGKLELSHEWVVSQLQRNASAAFDAEDFGASNRALELIGKHIGSFPERVIISDPTQLTDEELRHQADEAKRKLKLIA